MAHTDGPVWVTLDWGGVNPVMTVQDLGEGFSLEDRQMPAADSLGGGRGLMIATHLTRQLDVAAKGAGGSCVTAVLDVARHPTGDHDFAPSPTQRLPLASEANDGLFDRDGFLRALIVELAKAVEYDHGPDAAEAAVAQLGASVGGRMEQAYRLDRDLEGPLNHQEMAQFYVELKQALGGDFYVVDADERRIVLGNRACPFGEAVRLAPSLCRMTSSVFGGIAARNADRDVHVRLEERIALGDPECRVVVWLDDPPDGTAVAIHRYRRQLDPSE